MSINPKAKIHPNILRAAVVGVGSLGQHHARLYHQHPKVELVGVADVDETRLDLISKKYKCAAYRDYKALLSKVELVSIVVPTIHHFEVARHFLNEGIHVLLEKPMTRTLDEADELIKTAKQKKVILQVGHIERFNRAIQELRKILTNPRFIEVHRLGSFSQRNMDIGVVLDLMIHDLDIVLDLVRDEVSRVDAMGVRILSTHEDIANARVVFNNGCVANINASRVTNKTHRKLRIFTPTNYISIDYQKQEMVIYGLKANRSSRLKNLMNQITRKRIVFGREEPLKLEIEAYIQSIYNHSQPEVPGEVGRLALGLALEIKNQVQRQKNF